MIKKILHIIYNERRENSWLVLEIIAASIMLWLALNPLFTLISLKSIDDGYDISNNYVIDVNRYSTYDPRHKQEYASDSLLAASYTNLYNIVRDLPEVESHCLMYGQHYPGSNRSMHTEGFVMDSIYPDKNDKSLSDKEQAFTSHTIYETESNDYFRTFGVKDALTRKIFTPRENDTESNIYISENVAEEFFGSAKEAVGKKIYWGYDQLTISGVFKDMQVIDYCRPMRHVVVLSRLQQDVVPHLRLHIKLKKGTNKEAFEKKFREQIAPKLKSGNVRLTSFIRTEKEREKWNEQRGVYNKYTLYTSLALFSLFALFLGTLSAFWIRSAARKSEIGIMRSMGASRLYIIKQFIMETSLLVNIGFGVAMIFIAYYVYANGFIDPMQGIVPHTGELSNSVKLLHYATVTVASYAILMLTAICSATVPVWRITKILPADALREE